MEIRWQVLRTVISMFCPKCRSEYRPGFTRCADCDVSLVDELPTGDTGDPLVAFETSDASLIPIVESLLRGAGIPFEMRAAGLQGLFAAGQLGGFNPVSGPVAFLVAAGDARRARELLARLSESQNR